MSVCVSVSVAGLWRSHPYYSVEESPTSGRAGVCQKAAEGGPLAVRSTTTAAVGIVRGEDRSTNTYMSESYRQGIRGLRSVCISTKSHDLQVPGIP